MMNRQVLISRWRAQLKEQATPRAMAGLAVLVVVLAVWGLVELNSTVSGLRQSVEELERARRLELSLLTDQTWLESSVDLQQELERTQDAFWTGSTNGIVAAQLQGSVESAARNASLRLPRINITSTPDALGEDAYLFEISITAQDTNGQFLAFFQELSRSEHLIIVSRFNWRRSNGALDIRLQAPALIREQEDEA